MYADAAGDVDRLLDEVSPSTPIEQFTDHQRTAHTLWRVDESRVDRCRPERDARQAADHRRRPSPLRSRPALSPGDARSRRGRRIMMTFVNLHSPGLRTLAAHRWSCPGSAFRGRCAPPDREAAHEHRSMESAWTATPHGLCRLRHGPARRLVVYRVRPAGRGPEPRPFCTSGFCDDLLGITPGGDQSAGNS